MADSPSLLPAELESPLRNLQDSSVGPKLVPYLGRLRRRWAKRRDQARAKALTAQILAGMNAPGAWDYAIHRIAWTETDTTVAFIGPADRPAQVVLKLAQTPASAASLRRHSTALTALHADHRLGEWIHLVPRLISEGEIEKAVFTVEEALEGEQARLLLRDETTRIQMLTAAARAIRQLHRCTADRAIVGTTMLAQWIDDPLFLLKRWNETQPRDARHDKSLERLSAELRSALADRVVCVSWIHGDFAPGNFLVSRSAGTLTGILDWELARPGALPFLDTVLLLLATRMVVQRSDLGDVLLDLMLGAKWAPHELAILNDTREFMPGSMIGERTMLLMTWLRHVTDKLARSPGYARQRRWINKNIVNVLRNV